MLGFIHEMKPPKKRAMTNLFTTVIYVPGKVLFGDLREVVSSVTRNKETPEPKDE